MFLKIIEAIEQLSEKEAANLNVINILEALGNRAGTASVHEACLISLDDEITSLTGRSYGQRVTSPQACWMFTTQQLCLEWCMKINEGLLSEHYALETDVTKTKRLLKEEKRITAREVVAQAEELFATTPKESKGE